MSKMIVKVPNILHRAVQDVLDVSTNFLQELELKQIDHVPSLEIKNWKTTSSLQVRVDVFSNPMVVQIIKIDEDGSEEVVFCNT